MGIDSDGTRRGPSELDAAIVGAHQAAIEGGQPGYLDPSTGLFVLTAAYLSDRGSCCDNGCRHCPYG